jgi:hypothetical protein
MTLRIERASAQGSTIVRLIGRVQSEHLTQLKTQIEGPESHLALDLEEVTLVDVGVVRFLLVCEESGMELLHCSPYIRQWMVTEKAREGRG